VIVFKDQHSPDFGASCKVVTGQYVMWYGGSGNQVLAAVDCETGCPTIRYPYYDAESGTYPLYGSDLARIILAADGTIWQTYASTDLVRLTALD